MVKSTNSTTVETTKLSQQSSSSTKYTAKTQLHKVTRTATTTTPPTTTMSTTLNVDTSATEGNIEASKNVEGGMYCFLQRKKDRDCYTYLRLKGDIYILTDRCDGLVRASVS